MTDDRSENGLDYQTETNEKAINSLVEALIQETPERFESIDCTIEQLSNQCSGRYSYRISCKDFPTEVQTDPSDELHATAHSAMQQLNAEMLEMNLSAQGEGWSFEMKFAPVDDKGQDERNEKIWQTANDEREAIYIKSFGSLPEEIQRVMTVHFPGGGIFDFEQSKVSGKRVLVTCGLSNPDMPSAVKVEQFKRKDETKGSGERVVKSYESTLKAKTPRYVQPTLSGLGYELAMIIDPEDEISMAVPMWIVESELNEDADFLGLVQKHQGLTVQDLQLFDGSTRDFAFFEAQAPFPNPVQLSSGTFHLLIGMRITREELNFAKAESTAALVQRLMRAGLGQVTDYERGSVV